jgi:nicotinamidase-related amidase
MPPARNQDLHGNVPDESDVALLLIDVINDLEFEGGERLLPAALAAADRLAALAARARRAGVPVIYANDNFGRWRSNFHQVVEHCMQDGVRGRPLAELLKPDDKEDYFVLKPKHSAFYSTTLDTLLDYLQARTLILTGLAGNICVLFSANDAYMRDFNILVPRDCTASNYERDNEQSIEIMEKVLDVDTTPSTELDLQVLKRRAAEA